MTSYASHFAVRGPTPQTQPIAGRESEQVQNNAGGFVFAISDWDRLDRFLVLGAEGNTYYVSEKKMTIDNAQAVVRCVKEDGLRTVSRIVEISDAGRAPKNDPALFALALAASVGDEKTRRAALSALPKVARIGTHLFHFIEYVQAQRGWGRALRRAVANWYLEKDPDALAYQMVKYRQRDGWAHRDLLRLSHPRPVNAPADVSHFHAALFDWACGRNKAAADLPPIVKAYEAVTEAAVAPVAVSAIMEFDLPREAIPTELLNDVTVWDALLKKMPLTAMVRNLGKMTAIGLLKPFSYTIELVVNALTDEALIKKSRLHPIAILVALKTYAQRHGDKGSLTWQPVPQIIAALDKAFYLAFQNVVPTNKRILLALDVSGSMGSGSIAGTSLTPRDGAAALALMTASVEPRHHIVGFTCLPQSGGWSSGTNRHGGWSRSSGDGITPMAFSAGQRLDDCIRAMDGVPFGGTDCSLPWLYAKAKNLEIDAVVTITDNETYAGGVHPTEALRNYRQHSGINAKSIVIGMTATGFSIADPLDPGSLDVVGFDTATPVLISDFIRG